MSIAASSCSRLRLSPRPRPRRPGRLRQKPKRPARKDGRAELRPRAKAAKCTRAAGPSSAGSSTTPSGRSEWTGTNRARSTTTRPAARRRTRISPRSASACRNSPISRPPSNRPPAAARQKRKPRRRQESSSPRERTISWRPCTTPPRSGRSTRTTRRMSRSTIASASATRSTPGSLIIASRRRGFRSRARPCRAGSIFHTGGIAVLALEGPGQYESAVLGFRVSVPAWVAAGRAVMDWLAARAEIDSARIGIAGSSFGSLFGTIAAANEPRYRALAVSATCLEPGCHTIFEEASPTFKKRFMYMSGFTDEERFDEFSRTLTWEGHAEKIRVPYLCIAGEADELSPLEHTERLFKTLQCPRQLVVYQDSRHSVGGAPSANLGPTPSALVAAGGRVAKTAYA